MGFTVDQLEIALRMKDRFIGKSVLMISVQYPPSFSSIRQLANNSPEILSQANLEKIGAATQRNFYQIFFEILDARCVETVDISQEEGAEHVRDLGDKLEATDTLMSRFDWVIEGGTAEHISNPVCYFENIFNFLKPNGTYLGCLPSGNYMEHGLFQFSPTFFSDLVYANKSFLQLEHISLSLPRKNILLNPLYRDCIKSVESPLVLSNGAKLGKKRFHYLGFLTGTYLNSVNRSAIPAGVTVIIQKKFSGDLQKNFIQGEYRKSSLSAVIKFNPIPISQSTPNVIDRIFFIKLLKKLLVSFPCSYSIRLLLFKLLNFIYEKFFRRIRLEH